MNSSMEYQLKNILRHLEKQLEPMVDYSSKEEYVKALKLVRQTISDLDSQSLQPNSEALKGLL